MRVVSEVSEQDVVSWMGRNGMVYLSELVGC